ncbi:AbrB/MazE/SpoVT family DNA-binding domain-containing protein [Halonotius roseus]|uniref:AbrB/MazE/SpoVT family DNA-binding domain-containing protein n=1 Tax=Halonotius roseus TaxID=2511997 RepID=A0A544QPB9_9EURY|nr:AbrB/MazE/SpoVT family DNA-binding domain-containing protein [Halonotius roseus]TQQ80720.1 AbrB/MazE/SpoVT family DNA-binding domain-containing protein [Halonotius roseus]
METRKIQEVGGGTFTVSLPKAWTSDHGFEAGMELRLYTHRDGSILIRSSEAEVGWLADATVDLDAGDPDAGDPDGDNHDGDDSDGNNSDGVDPDAGDPEAAARAVRTAHTVGFETITLRRRGAFTEAEREAVRSTVRELVGTDILTESDAEITIGHLLDTSSASVRQSVIQLQYVVVSLLRDAAEAFGDAADTQTRVCDRAAEARRSAEMITRHFSRSLVSYAELDSLGVSRSELFAYYEIATRLETVTEQAVRIATTSEELPEPPSAEAAAAVRAVVDDVARAVDDAVTAVLNGELTTAQQARERSADAIEQIDAVEQRLYEESVSDSVPAAVALSTTLTHLRRAANCSCGIADVAARTAIRAENIDL